MAYKGLDRKSIEEYVRIAGETADTITKELTKESVFDPIMIKALDTVESMIKKKKCVVYGGTALNAIMPPHLQFYDPEYDLPDWDFFTNDPIMTAIEIADKVRSKTGTEVSVTTAAHEGTYKIFAEGQAIADITYVSKNVLNILREHSIIKNGIHYSGPDYLRMSAYLELSRPLGQPDRWEKVMRRLSLLNKVYPIKIPVKKDKNVDKVKEIKTRLMGLLMDVQDTKTLRKNGEGDIFAFIGPEIFSVVRRIIQKSSSGKSPIPMRVGSVSGGIMLMSPSPEKTCELVMKCLKETGSGSGGGSGSGSKNRDDYNIIKKDGSGEFLGERYVIYHGKGKRDGHEVCTIVGVHNACQSIYTIRVKHQRTTRSIRIGSVESMLYIYNSLLFSKKGYKDTFGEHEILRAVDSLIKLHIRVFSVQNKSIIPLPIECIGEQETIKKMREDKKKDIKKLMAERGKTSIEYIRRNIRYDGGDKNMRRIIERAIEREKEHKNRS
jgi:hypothetical protein